MGKVFVVMVVLFMVAFVLGIVLRRRDRGTELFVTEASGRQPVDGPLEDAVLALMRQGRKNQAIKLIRTHTGLGLKEAKDMYDSL